MRGRGAESVLSTLFYYMNASREIEDFLGHLSSYEMLAFVKGVSFVGDKGYNEVRKSVIRSMLKFVNSEGNLFV